ncbi:MAG: glucose-1-phosphate adenylyltransferase, partial [Verrucomicrobia bacterium]
AEVPRRRVQAHFFKGYWRDIGTIRAFFDAHMDLVRSTPAFSFHDAAWPFYTRPRYLPGALLQDCRFDHALLGEGSVLEGSTFNHSVVGMRSSVRGASLDHVLLMGVDSHYPDTDPSAPPVGVGPGSVIRNAIIDKNARIGRDVRVVNDEGLTEADGDQWVIRDGLVVIPKNAVIPDGTVI